MLLNCYVPPSHCLTELCIFWFLQFPFTPTSWFLKYLELNEKLADSEAHWYPADNCCFLLALSLHCMWNPTLCWAFAMAFSDKSYSLYCIMQKITEKLSEENIVMFVSH